MKTYLEKIMKKDRTSNIIKGVILGASTCAVYGLAKLLTSNLINPADISQFVTENSKPLSYALLTTGLSLGCYLGKK